MRQEDLILPALLRIGAGWRISIVAKIRCFAIRVFHDALGACLTLMPSLDTDISGESIYNQREFLVGTSRAASAHWITVQFDREVQ